ncbi:MAG TPA: TIM barrel protein [Dermatophilaceae bacterium]|jgi:sugar phosphate isomerase/epimerase
MTGSTSSDHGLLIGMTVALPQLDLESAIDVLAASGFEAVEVFMGQLGPRIVEVPLFEAHAAAARSHISRRGLVVSTFNGIVGVFDPFSSAKSFDEAVQFLIDRLRLAEAIGAPRLLTWDGELTDRRLIERAPQILASCIAAAQAEYPGPGTPEVCVELHPNTFALKFDMLEPTADALVAVGAGICLDITHFAVAMGPDFASQLSERVLSAVTHVHFSDSDARSEQLHFPPGAGVVDLSDIADRLAGRGLSAAWDLFGWPFPRQAVTTGLSEYRRFLSRLHGEPEPAS